MMMMMLERLKKEAYPPSGKVSSVAAKRTRLYVVVGVEEEGA